MALELPKDTPFGISALYHRISDIRLREDKKVDIALLGYLSQEARQSGLEPLMRIFIEGLDCGSIAALYTAIKARPEFSGAEDV